MKHAAELRTRTKAHSQELDRLTVELGAARAEALRAAQAARASSQEVTHYMSGLDVLQLSPL